MLWLPDERVVLRYLTLSANRGVSQHRFDSSPGGYFHPTTTHMDVDVEELTGLLAPATDGLGSVKVFPLIPHIRNDAMVSIATNTWPWIMC